jgi:hypothetical protein
MHFDPSIYIIVASTFVRVSIIFPSSFCGLIRFVLRFVKCWEHANTVHTVVGGFGLVVCAHPVLVWLRPLTMPFSI